MRTTHTYAVLQLTQGAFEEIRAKLEAAGYQHAFNLSGPQPVIDMQGIGVEPEPRPPVPPELKPECDPTRPEWAKDVLVTFLYLLLRDVGPVMAVRNALVEAVRIGAPGRHAALTDRELAAMAQLVISRADIEAMPSTPEFDG